MGYYVQLTEADFIIPESQEVLEALRAMPVKYRSLMRGGSSNGEKWFSWMNNEEIESATSAQYIFQALGFECEANPYGQEGTFRLTDYNSKVGQEDLFMAVVAPFVAEDSFTEWRGEDGEIWRYVVHGGKLRVQSSTIAWNESEPFKVTFYESEGSFKDNTYRTLTFHIDPYVEDVNAEIANKKAKSNA
jgi:hypothetical protein